MVRREFTPCAGIGTRIALPHPDINAAGTRGLFSWNKLPAYSVWIIGTGSPRTEYFGRRTSHVYATIARFWGRTFSSRKSTLASARSRLLSEADAASSEPVHAAVHRRAGNGLHRYR